MKICKGSFFSDFSNIHEKVKYLRYFLGVHGVYFVSHYCDVYVLYFSYRCLPYMSKHIECLSQYHIYKGCENCGINFCVFALLFSICRSFLQILFHIYVFWNVWLKGLSIIIQLISYYHILRLSILPYFLQWKKNFFRQICFLIFSDIYE